jgi:hypothetical protein
MPKGGREEMVAVGRPVAGPAIGVADAAMTVAEGCKVTHPGDGSLGIRDGVIDVAVDGGDAAAGMDTGRVPVLGVAPYWGGVG